MSLDHPIHRDLANTLSILDCCYALIVAIEGNNELLAASSRERIAGSDFTTSFRLVLTNYWKL